MPRLKEDMSANFRRTEQKKLQTIDNDSTALNICKQGSKQTLPLMSNFIQIAAFDILSVALGVEFRSGCWWILLVEIHSGTSEVKLSAIRFVDAPSPVFEEIW